MADTAATPAAPDNVPASGGATCYCGEVHKQRPRISPTSEITRLVEVWVAPEMRAALSQHLQGDTRDALDADAGRQVFWLKLAEHFNNPDVVFEPYSDEHTEGHRGFHNEGPSTITASSSSLLLHHSSTSSPLSLIPKYASSSNSRK